MALIFQSHFYLKDFIYREFNLSESLDAGFVRFVW